MIREHKRKERNDMKKFNASNEWAQFLEVWQKGDKKPHLILQKK